MQRQGKGVHRLALLGCLALVVAVVIIVRGIGGRRASVEREEEKTVTRRLGLPPAGRRVALGLYGGRFDSLEMTGRNLVKVGITRFCCVCVCVLVTCRVTACGGCVECGHIHHGS